MIYIAGDKHGYNAIEFVKNYLSSHKIEYENLGVQNETQTMKLEDMIPAVTTKVKEKETNRGILVCGTGIGVEVGANKFSGIRACLATNEKIAEWSAVYDKCNVLCLVGWDIDQERTNKILDAWLNSVYDGSTKRLAMFEEFNNWH
jgi:ribose 5-phosphate isomerase B